MERTNDSTAIPQGLAIPELAALLAHLPGNAEVTLTIKAEELRTAVEMATGGPAIMSTRQASDVFGWCPKRWRGWAEAGRIAGAVQEDGPGSPWRLPRESCRAVVEEEMAAARRPPPRMPKDGQRTRPRRINKSRRTQHQQERSIRRGPRTPKNRGQ